MKKINLTVTLLLSALLLTAAVPANKASADTITDSTFISVTEPSSTSVSGPDSVIVTSPAYGFHSALQEDLYYYLSSSYNRESVNSRAIQLHGGITSNNCVYFASEALRRVGQYIPTTTANTSQLISQLSSRGWYRSYDLYSLKKGDLVFAGKNGYLTHVYTFMGWYSYSQGIAYVVDNQDRIFGNEFHLRNVFSYDSRYDTDPSMFYYYKPY